MDPEPKPTQSLPVRPTAAGNEKHFEDFSTTLRGAYLALYNLLSAILWAFILARVICIWPLWGASELHRTTGGFVTGVQSLAVLEVFHSAFGLVRAPLLTTAMQVASRLLLVWLVYPVFPSVPATHWQNASMLLAWSLTETVRYTYFFGLLGGLDELGGVPRALRWLRYNGFWLLYPVGIASECWLLSHSLKVAGETRAGVPGGGGGGGVLGVVREGEGWMKGPLGAVLGAYVPGSVVLYSHMVKQRARVMRKWSEDDKKDAVKKGQ